MRNEDEEGNPAQGLRASPAYVRVMSLDPKPLNPKTLKPKP